MFAWSKWCPILTGNRSLFTVINEHRVLGWEVLGDKLRASKQLIARFQLLTSLSDSGEGEGDVKLPQHWPSSVFAVCAVSRRWHFIGANWT